MSSHLKRVITPQTHSMHVHYTIWNVLLNITYYYYNVALAMSKSQVFSRYGSITLYLLDLSTRSVNDPQQPHWVPLYLVMTELQTQLLVGFVCVDKYGTLLHRMWNVWQNCKWVTDVHLELQLIIWIHNFTSLPF